MKTFIILLLTVLSLSSCAQIKYGIVKAHAYSKPVIPGIISDEDPHKKPDTIYLVYLETTSKSAVKWSKAYIGNSTYNVLPRNVDAPYNIGILSDKSDSTILRVRRLNKLVQLTLEKTDAGNNSGKGINNSRQILLKGRAKNKAVNYRAKVIGTLRPTMTV